MDRILYRSTKYRKIAGVCGGLGEYFNVDPVIFRILFLLFFFVFGGGLFAYIIMWFIIPKKQG